MPTIEISEEAYDLLKIEAETNTELMAKSPSEWFLTDIAKIADTILRRELDSHTRRDHEMQF